MSSDSLATFIVVSTSLSSFFLTVFCVCLFACVLIPFRQRWMKKIPFGICNDSICIKTLYENIIPYSIFTNDSQENSICPCYLHWQSFGMIKGVSVWFTSEPCTNNERLLSMEWTLCVNKHMQFVCIRPSAVLFIHRCSISFFIIEIIELIWLLTQFIPCTYVDLSRRLMKMHDWLQK